MHVESIALKLHRMGPWLEQTDPYPNRTRQQFDGAPFGCAQVTIDPTSTEAAASFNRNRIHLCGRSGGLSYEGLTELIDLFTAKGVKRAFVWLSPGPEMEAVREWLRSKGLERVVWTRYPTVALLAPPEISERSAFETRTVDRDEIVAAREQFGIVTMTGFEESVGREDFRHYMAFDAGHPIATAALVRYEDIGYLTYAYTSESDRRRGAQTALIARRAEDARNLGCTHVISQTLTMLKSSFANLRRCGFREIYDQEVYELRRG